MQVILEEKEYENLKRRAEDPENLRLKAFVKDLRFALTYQLEARFSEDPLHAVQASSMSELANELPDHARLRCREDEKFFLRRTWLNFDALTERLNTLCSLHKV